jgi:hypothetical protein
MPQPAVPGREPPQSGTWPARWSKYKATSEPRTLDGLDGLGFPLKVPPHWECTAVEKASGYVKYHCGAPPGKELTVGGELVVRVCPHPCTGDQRRAMRSTEVAWGLQWIRAGEMTTYAESDNLEVDDRQRYGLVLVGYWRTGSRAEVDRQVVLRMTGPPDDAAQIHRVANYLRDILTL